MTKQLAVSVGVGLVIGGLAWIDPLFVPLVLAGPLISGAVGGLRRLPLQYLTLTWLVAGLSMLISDWVANHEDKAFHALLTAVMVGLASFGWVIGAQIERRRTRSAVSVGEGPFVSRPEA